MLLLNTRDPAFSFISKARFDSTRYDDEVCNAIEDTVNLYRPHVLKSLKVLLPALAAGFQRQKGDFFYFGEYDEKNSNRLSQMDQEKLEGAPINNLGA